MWMTIKSLWFLILESHLVHLSGTDQKQTYSLFYYFFCLVRFAFTLGFFASCYYSYTKRRCHRSHMNQRLTRSSCELFNWFIKKPNYFIQPFELMPPNSILRPTRLHSFSHHLYLVLIFTPWILLVNFWIFQIISLIRKSF